MKVTVIYGNPKSPDSLGHTTEHLPLAGQIKGVSRASSPSSCRALTARNQRFVSIFKAPHKCSNR
jgi:hypothetical protein